MNSLRKKSYLAVALLILLAFSVASVAQTSNGTLVGVVSDPNGAVIPNAAITAVNNDTGEKHTGTSNSLGAYRIEAVGPGTYTVTAKAANFAELKIQNVVVTASVTTTANAGLKLGVAETTIEVQGLGQTLHTEDGGISHDIANVEITQIPLATGNPIELVFSQPGVARPTQGDFTNGVGFSVDGTRPRSNNFLIEGQDNNDSAIQGQALQVINVEATKELSFQTNSYSAEFGHGGGSVTNLIYKSGTNNWHGSVYDTINNSSLDSADAGDKLNGTPKAISRENQYGFTIGGPIKKDKLFIFGSSQWDKTRQTANGATLVLPTANGVATLESLPANQNITNYLKAIGNLRGLTQTSTIALGAGRPGLEVGDVQRSVGEPADDLQYVIKSDWVPNQNDSVTVRYIYDKNTLTPDFFNNPGALPGFETEQGGTVHNAGINYSHVFNAHLVNEVRVSFGRIGFSFTDTPQTLTNPLALGPSIGIGGVSGFGAPGGIPQARTHDTYQLQDTISLNKGNHSFKFGADLLQTKVVDEIPFNSFGSISYGSGGGFSGFGNYIDDFTGVSGSVTRAFGSPFARPHYFYQNYFAQDTWKMKSNLTVTLGARYEYGGTPENNLKFPAIVPVQGFGGASSVNFVPQQPARNNWAPRVGIAYTHHFWSGLFGENKTVLRAGFGTFYDGLFTNIIDNSAATSPNAVNPLLISTAGRGIASASTQFANLNPNPSPFAAVQSVAADLKAPTTYQWNFDIERELQAKFVLTTAYVGTRGLRLFANDDLNPGDVTIGDGTRINQNLGAVSVRDNSGDSIYHSLQLNMQRKFSNGLLLQTAYTYSRAIDDASEVFITTGASSFASDPTLGHRGADRGLSAFNHSHVLAVTYVYDLPHFKNDSSLGFKALGQVVNGWQISGVATYQTGAPESVVDGVDVRGLDHAVERPNTLNPNAPLLNAAIDGGSPLGGFPLAGGTPGQLCEYAAANATGVCDPFVNGTATIVRDANGNIIGFKNGVPLTSSNTRYFIPANGIGNVGRNSVVAPGRQDWTFGLQREFKIGERQRFYFRTEMINPLNHPNTGNATFNLANLAFIDTQAIDPGPGNGSLAPPTQTVGNYGLTTTGQRIIRFKMKYSF